MTRLQKPAPPLASCVILDELINLSEPQYLHLQKEYKNKLLIGFLHIIKEATLVKRSHSTCFSNIISLLRLLL